MNHNDKVTKLASRVSLNLTLDGKFFESLKSFILMDKEEAFSIFGISENEHKNLCKQCNYGLSDLLFALSKLHDNLIGNNVISDNDRNRWLNNNNLFAKAIYRQTNKGMKEDFFCNPIIINLIKAAEELLNDEEYQRFNIILNNLSNRYIEREAILKLCSKESGFSNNDNIKAILDWATHWIKVHHTMHILGIDHPLWYNDIKDFSDYDKQLYFWLFLYEEIRDNPEELDEKFPPQYRVFTEDNLKRLSEYLHRLSVFSKVTFVNNANSYYDDEGAIMSALDSGCGDVYGFD